MNKKPKPLQEQKAAVLAILRAGQTPEEKTMTVDPEKFKTFKAKVDAFYSKGNHRAA
jgi:hypothetical protein